MSCPMVIDKTATMAIADQLPVCTPDHYDILSQTSPEFDIYASNCEIFRCMISKVLK